MQIDQRQLDRDIDRLQSLFKNVADVMKKDTQGIMKHTAILAIQSSVKLTQPGDKGKVSKMPKKFRFRPLVAIPVSVGYYYTDGDRIFKTKEKLKPKQMRDGKLTRVPKGIKAWSKKKRAFTYIPYVGKKNESDKRFKIHAAGAAKVGWLKAYGKLSGKPIDTGDNKNTKKHSRVTVRQDLIEIVNLVSYASKTSPHAARMGLHKATNKLVNQWVPKIEKRIERDWEKRQRTFIKAIGKLT